MTGPQRGDYYVAPRDFWRLVVGVFLAGGATVIGLDGVWLGFLVAALLLALTLGLDVSIHRLPTSEERRHSP